MRLTVVAVGRTRRTPEAELFQDYADRTAKAGRALGLGPVALQEVEDKKSSGPAGEAALLLSRIPEGAKVVALDERGKLFSSPDFAERLARWRDDGVRDCCFVIGGADGLDASVLARADAKLSFGPMVWPHMLVRAMLAEQIYRAVTILAGSPYHRV